MNVKLKRVSVLLIAGCLSHSFVACKKGTANYRSINDRNSTSGEVVVTPKDKEEERVEEPRAVKTFSYDSSNIADRGLWLGLNVNEEAEIISFSLPGISGLKEIASGSPSYKINQFISKVELYKAGSSADTTYTINSSNDYFNAIAKAAGTADARLIKVGWASQPSSSDLSYTVHEISTTSAPSNWFNIIGECKLYNSSYGSSPQKVLESMSPISCYVFCQNWANKAICADNKDIVFNYFE